MESSIISTRRTALKSFGAALGLGTGLTLGSRPASGQQTHRLIVESRTDDRVDYDLLVSGQVRTLDRPAGDHADGSHASGAVWWRDGYAFTGDITALTWSGPIRVLVDGREITPERTGTTLRFEGDDGERTDYEFSVSGEVVAGRHGDQADGSHASGTVWNWRDNYVYSGAITDFKMDGPAAVYRNGSRVDPDTLGGSPDDGSGGSGGDGDDTVHAFDERVERAIHARVNEIRSNRGLDTLDWHAGLARVADSYSRRMATEGFFSHTDPSGDGPGDRYADAGISCNGWGENIAYNYASDLSAEQAGRETVSQWMNSAGHRANILREWYTLEGIGVYVTDDGRLYATQNFGTSC